MPNQTAANRTLTPEELHTLDEQVEELINSISDDNWRALQKITLADLLESSVGALALNSLLSNVQKLKTAVPEVTEQDLVFLTDVSDELNQNCRSLRGDLFNLLNELVGTKNKVKINHLLPEEMHGFAKDALRGMNDAGLRGKYGLNRQNHLVWVNTLINSGWLAKVPDDLVAQIRAHQLLKAAGLKK